MSTSHTPAAVGCQHRECLRPQLERWTTLPNLITAVRTSISVLLGLMATGQQSLGLLIASLVVYWVGDVADGAVARLTDRETRLGAVFDIVSDRMCALVFYLGLAWLQPELALPIGLYVVNFAVLDMMLSLAFTSWPLSSPNYFHWVDRRIWLLNWSKPAKTVNSALFAVLLLWTSNVWLGTLIAAGLIFVKAWSLMLLQRVAPTPDGVHCVHQFHRQVIRAGAPG